MRRIYWAVIGCIFTLISVVLLIFVQYTFNMPHIKEITNTEFPGCPGFRLGGLIILSIPIGISIRSWAKAFGKW